MSDFVRLRPIARAYVTAVVLLGIAVVSVSIDHLWRQPIGLEWLILAALTLLTGSFTVKVPSINASLSVSETFVFASVLLFGPSAGATTVLLECLIILFWMKPEARSPHRLLFNTAAPAISIWTAGTAFFYISGIQPYSVQPTPLERLFIPLLLFTSLYFLLNSWLVAIALGFETRTSATGIWWNNFTWLSINYFSGASVAALLVTYTRHLDVGSLVIIVPLLVVSYLTFRTAMGRVEDTNQHLEQLNRLYLSTIETLAMAIDAKDQVTHGHIRRVQVFATKLARHLGVKDKSLLRAIEAAALLHDMGKLAVPEYILNKPGKLTPEEFDKMKLHVTVGADILSAIDFPYPVVPIVRHHHENWDGTGYPSGLKGTDIPIGARILSVVDCFDALTSDRPYRPRLTDEDAMAILRTRRGTMYDPLVIDTFVRVRPQLGTDPMVPLNSSEAALREIAGARHPVNDGAPGRMLEKIAASSDEVSTLYELITALARHEGFGTLCDLIASHVRRLIPSALCVFYLIDDRTFELHAKYAVGRGSNVVLGMRIPLGQRLSGWVAAHKGTIVNSDPILDLGEVARPTAFGLRGCLSTPLITDDGVAFGVLTLYSSETNSFTEDHRRIIEVVGQRVASPLRRAIQSEKMPSGESAVRLPITRAMSEHRRSPIADLAPESVALAVIDVRGMKRFNEQFGRDLGDELIRIVGQRVSSGLRAGDTLLRSVSDEFIVIFDSVDVESANRAVEAIRQLVCSDPMYLAQNAVTVDVAVAVAISPQDGKSIKDLLSTANRRLTYRRQVVEVSSVH